MVHTTYSVLARKYRPTTFAALIGQDMLVRTLTNAIQSGRLAHAYMLSGLRGVGKTTTARILASALNCIGPNGTSGPTATPCHQCEHCCAIAADRHVDVLEMDAASCSSVNDIREIIEGLRYKPARARYKVYILDEVHMLSHQAFTALLKSLEEPPEHVKFIFATTEINKVPVTILSRCQRFDLRRIDTETLISHFVDITKEEGVLVEGEALRLIASAADGSVRDGLFFLEKAIVCAIASHDSAESRDMITASGVRKMLGLADRTIILHLLDALLQGEIERALNLLKKQHDSGADPSFIIQEMLVLLHWLTKLKVVPASVAKHSAMAAAEYDRSKSMAAKLSIAVLTRAWQMLLKALVEVRTAPSPLQAAEMALIRVAYAATLPTPLEIVSSFQKQEPLALLLKPQMSPSSSTTQQLSSSLGNPGSFADVIALCRAQGEMQLAFDLQHQIQPVHFKPSYISLRTLYKTPRNPSRRLERLLREWTGQQWIVHHLNENDKADTTLQEQNESIVAGVAAHPLVKAVLETFPGARIHNASAAADFPDSQGTTTAYSCRCPDMDTMDPATHGEASESYSIEYDDT